MPPGFLADGVKLRVTRLGVQQLTFLLDFGPLCLLVKQQRPVGFNFGM
jgi:hypothetical protein